MIVHLRLHNQKKKTEILLWGSGDKNGLLELAYNIAIITHPISYIAK